MSKIGTGLLRTFAAGLTCFTIASSANAATNTTNAPYAPTYGKTLPPIGYVSFCARHKSDCQAIRTGATEVDLENHPEFWSQLRQVNNYVNKSIAPVSDQALYNVPEMWEIPTTAGDCEDYVLLKKRHLEALGFPSEALLITVVLDEVGDGHAVLMARTTRGDFILDNRRNDIRLWATTGYHLIKRQSQENPQVWVQLTEKKRKNRVISGGN